MDLRHIRYFIAVAEELNIRRASLRLHISQPPLTRQIQQLEEELGVQLFVRTPRGMELTPPGALFLTEARNIRAVVEQATERTQRAGQGKLGRLDIAIFGSGILDTIPKLLLEFRNAFPDVKVILHTMTKEAQIEALRQRRIDAGFNRFIEPFSDIANEIVTTEKLLLAVNEDHVLARETCVPFQALADHPLILFPAGTRNSFLDKVLSMCQQAGFIPQIAQEVGDTLTGVALVASNFGVCLVPESATVLALPGVVYRPLSDVPGNTQVDLNCIYRADDPSPILESFLDTVRNYRNRTR
ncbi:LysR substrate-binding domain-containing protein [Pseudomonas sp. N040]|uniref:LysR substrate-binding domain-containing protein n=1 Tax=Pseudomonas sp. N040 TaxID=2785325 RepID=UPI0018A2981A|nr:LysR substrate-binding domain-containing protein [Pseudomonas sp. N040]MBF7729140.1 LysR family transcriptional regulator [Pseudomonas sp. N040]MBW7012780.1 LysR family transcriptional regulator [Pseudomonas sp. N040]